MRRNLKENLFSAIDDLISATQVIFSHDSLSQKLREIDGGRSFDARCINRYLKRFEAQGLVKIRNTKGRDSYCLTEKGFRKLADFNFKNIGKKEHKKWDGLWRVVVFDIPEEKKSVREGLRRKLNYFNFYALQKSVFVFPFDCDDKIDELANFFEVGDCIYVLLVKSLGRKEAEVRGFFGAELM